MRQLQSVGAAVSVRTPARAPEVRADVGTAASAAMVSGVLVGTAAAAVGLAAGLALGVEPGALAAGLGLGWVVVASGTAAVDWFLQRGRLQESLWVHEVREAGAARPDPAPAREGGWLAVNAGEARASAVVDEVEAGRRARVEGLVGFVRRCAELGTSEAAHGVTPATREGFCANRDVLIEIGAARWRGVSARAGWELAVSPAEAVGLVKRHVVAK